MVGEGERLKLSEYTSTDPIFIDANIFLDYAIPNPRYCGPVANFLERVELLEINAVTTPSVLEEVSYILLMNMGKRILKTTDHQIIVNSIKRDDAVAQRCYRAIDKFNELLVVWKGLKILAVDQEDYMQVSGLGKKFRLLSSDAMHLSVMKKHKIESIASRDSDFERVQGIRVWIP